MVARDTAAGANPTYTVTMLDDRAGAVNVDANIVAFSGEANTITDSGSVAVGTTRTVIGSRTTTFAAGDDVVIGAFQYDNTNVAARTMAVDAVDIRLAGASVDSSNEFLIDNHPAGEVSALWPGFVRKVTTTSANPTYEGAMAASATGVNAELKIAAIHIADTGGAALIRFGNETVNITEGILKFIEVIQLANESLSISEVLVKARAQVRFQNENESIAEALVKARAQVRFQNENENITENITKLTPFIKFANETVNITEGVLALIAIAIIKVVDETVNITEGILRILGLTRVVDETEQILEATLSLVGQVRVVDETEDIIEGVIQLLGAGVVKVVGGKEVIIFP